MKCFWILKDVVLLLLLNYFREIWWCLICMQSPCHYSLRWIRSLIIRSFGACSTILVERWTCTGTWTRLTKWVAARIKIIRTDSKSTYLDAANGEANDTECQFGWNRAHSGRNQSELRHVRFHDRDVAPPGSSWHPNMVETLIFVPTQLLINWTVCRVTSYSRRRYGLESKFLEKAWRLLEVSDSC